MTESCRSGSAACASACCTGGRCLKIEILPGEARCELAEGDPVELVHHGERILLAAGSPRLLPWQLPRRGPK